MKSSTTTDFWERYHALPPDAKSRARKVYHLWKADPRHPSLQFQKKGNYWAINISPGYRALARESDDILYWFWIGAHDEYERLLRQP